MPTKKYIPTHWRSIFMPWIAFLLAAVSLGVCIYLLGQYNPEPSQVGQTLFIKSPTAGQNYSDEIASVNKQLIEAVRMNDVIREYVMNISRNPNNPAWPTDVAVLKGRVALTLDIPPLPLFIHFDDSNTEYLYNGGGGGIQYFSVSITDTTLHENCRNEKLGEWEYCSEEEWKDAMVGDTLEQRYFLKLQNYQGPFELRFEFSSEGTKSCSIGHDSKSCTDDLKYFRKNVKKILENLKVDYLS